MRAVLIALATVIAVLAAPAAALAGSPPVDRPGPPLSPPADRLAASLACTGSLAGATRAPVLLVPGTGEDPDFFDWNYMPALARLGIPQCAVTLPAHGTADVQVAAEYVVHAIRTMRARAGRPIAIIGHSQGGMIGRWALRFWPDTRPMVDDLIGLAPSNHGTTASDAVCGDSCNAAAWQQGHRSNFIRALNAPVETFRGVSYTSVYTRFDEIVTPPTSAALRGGEGRIANIETQAVCPANAAEHLVLGSSDAVGHALAVDALGHDGPADPARVDRLVCAQPAHPGVDPATFATDAAASYAKVARQFASGSPALPKEPPLACYASDTCPAGGAPGATTGTRPKLRVSRRPHEVRTGRRTSVRIRVRAREGGALRPVAGALVRIAGARARTDGRGRATVRKRFIRRGRRTLLVTRRGYRSARLTVRVARR